MNKILNILVTGSRGFIGKNFINKLKNKKNVNILEFNRSNSFEELEELVLKCDLIFHFAGEVRPDSTSSSFKESNVTLTEKIINILDSNNKKVKIILASTIHASSAKNDYGITKRESEIIIEEYGLKNNIEYRIFRLPHLFGEGCKPNYNSVISTWIYNSHRNLDINVFDRNIPMNYLYIQDLVEEFISQINETYNSRNYIEPKNIYQVTLGEVVDFIFEFKQNINNSDYKVSENTFKEKLLKTYKSYIKGKSV